MRYATRLLKDTGRVLLQGGILTALLALFVVGTGDLALAQKAGAGKGGKQTAPAKKPPSTWVKVCYNSKDGKRQGCITRSDIIEHVVLEVYGVVGIETVEATKKKSLIVTLPYAVITTTKVKDPKTKEDKVVPATLQFTWDIGGTVKAKVDGGAELKMKLLYCYRIGCVASAEISDDVIAKMKKGKEITVVGKTFAAGGGKGRDVPLPVSLNGFGAAFDGKPVDKKKYEIFWRREIAKQNLAKLNRQNQIIKQLQEKQKAAAANKKPKGKGEKK